MALIKNGRGIIDPFIRIRPGEPLPADGALLVPLCVWQDHWERLVCRRTAIGVQLASHEHPEIIGDDVDQLDLIALEFPSFRDGRAYSHARLIRERYGFTGELRAVGDVLVEQLHYMQRVGFDAFEIVGDDPLADYETVSQDFTVWYQATGDGRRPASALRRARSRLRDPS